MNRIIKFRAWARRNDDWEDDGEKRKFVMIGSDSLAFEEYAPLEDLLKSEDDDFYLMQYTGLKDKHGKEIYEGDIVTIGTTLNDKPYVWAIVWHVDRFCTLDYKKRHRPQILTRAFWSKCKVIGNIYENPELLP